MTLASHQDQDVLILRPGHKLTVSDGGEELSRVVHEALEAGTRRILLDLSATEFMDSLGVGQVVASFVSVRNKGGQLVLCGLQPRIALVLRMANLHMVLDMRESGPESVAF